MKMSVTCKYFSLTTDSANGSFLIHAAVNFRAVTVSRAVKLSSAMIRYCIVIGKQFGLKLKIQICRQLVKPMCESEATFFFFLENHVKSMVLKLIQDTFSFCQPLWHIKTWILSNHGAKYETAQLEIWLFQAVYTEGNKQSDGLWSLWCLAEVSSHLPTEVFRVGAEVWMNCPQPCVQGKIITAGPHSSDLF